MSNDEKLNEIMRIVLTNTMPKDQLGFFTENDLARMIYEVLNR